MFDLGWSEILIIGVVALIVVGPRDFPKMFRAVGRYVGQLKSMAREFQRTMDKAADEAGVSEITSGIKAATNPKKFGLDKLEEISNDMKKDFMIPNPVDGSILSSDANKSNTTGAQAKETEQTPPDSRIESINEAEENSKDTLVSDSKDAPESQENQRPKPL